MIGSKAHPLYNHILELLLASQNIKIDREVQIDPSKGIRSSRVDDMIIRDSKFISKIERGFKFNIPSNIKEIAIDYTLTRNIRFLLQKLEKGYQTRDRFLLIVLTGHMSSSSVISRFNRIMSLGAQNGRSM